MEHNLKATGLTLTPEIRDYVDKKLGNLDKFLTSGDAARADVELEYLESEGKLYRVELMLHDRVVIRAEARAYALHEAFDKAAQELFTELTRAKKKRVHALRHNAAKVKEYLRGWRDRL